MKNFFILLTTLFCTGYVFAQKGNQMAWYETGENMKIDSNRIQVQPGKLFFQFDTDHIPRNMKSLGFTWYDYNPKDYFVSHLVNNTDSTFKAKRQDGSLIMIQEALDEDSTWKPIEYWVHSGCGNSYFSPLKLEPGECIMVPIKKYSGSFKTQIRLKFKYGKSVIYTNSFEAKISKAQFKREENTVYGILYSGPAIYLE